MAGLYGIKRKLTSEQLKLLAAEIDRPEYNDMTAGGICKPLNSKPLTSNPKQQGEVDGQSVSIATAVGRLTREEYDRIAATDTGKTIMSLGSMLQNIDLKSTLATELMESLVPENLLTQKRLDELFDAGKVLDPTWEAQVAGQSRGEELLGGGWVVEGEDIIKAQVI